MRTLPGNDPRTPALHAALALLSAAVISFQVVLMQILSFSLWHHFAYMIIAMALLGFGAAGSVLAVWRASCLRARATLMPACCFGGGAAMAAAVWAIQWEGVFFDPYLHFSTGQPWRLGATYLILLVPLFLAALPIGLLFTLRAGQIGPWYATNLAASGLGGPLALAALHLLPLERTPVFCGALLWGAGCLLLPARGRLLRAGCLAAAAAMVVTGWRVPEPRLSSFKDLQRTRLLPDARTEARASSPHGMLHVVSAPALRPAPPVTLAQPVPLPAASALFVNGQAYGFLLPWKEGAGPTLLDHTTRALPYAVRRPERVLALHAGGGGVVAQALERGAARVTVIERHPLLARWLQTRLDGRLEGLFTHPRVRLLTRAPRHYLSTSRGEYDLILFPELSAFGGDGGLFALSERHDLTREGFTAAWNRLSRDGMLAVPVWMDSPPRAPLRVLATLAETARLQGIDDPSRHIAAAKNWGHLTFVLKRSPLTPEDQAAVRAFCEDLQFDPVLLPGVAPEERSRYHVMEDGTLLAHFDALLGDERETFYREYLFHIRPAEDRRPFFGHYLRPRTLSRLRRLFGASLPFLELGYLMPWITLLQTMPAVLALILLPLLLLRLERGGRAWCWLHFTALGLGYLFVEIVLIQHFVLFLGQPLQSAALVMGTMLAASGAGSLASSRLPTRGGLAWSLGLIAATLLVYSAGLPAWLAASLRLPAGARLFLALVLVALPAFFMGFPFPLGLRRLDRINASLVPWAWGINACFSVLGAIGAVLLALTWGFDGVMRTAAAIYGLAVLALLRVRS